jgi:hypothetical protein
MPEMALCKIAEPPTVGKNEERQEIEPGACFPWAAFERRRFGVASIDGCLLVDSWLRSPGLAWVGPGDAFRIHLGHKHPHRLVWHCDGRLQFASLVARPFFPESRPPRTE